jgi:hypothetical protein
MSNTYRTFKVYCHSHQFCFINKTASETAIITAKRIFGRLAYNEEIKELTIKVIETTCHMPRIEYNYTAMKKPFLVVMNA